MNSEPYRCKHFDVSELVPEDLLNDTPEPVIWRMFDNRALMSLDALRETFGKAVVNTWPFGGDAHFRGFRPPGCGVGVTHSQHRFGGRLTLRL